MPESDRGCSPSGTSDAHYFDWSPDGKYIIYTFRALSLDGRPITRDGQVLPHQIWIAALNTPYTHCVTPNDMCCGLPQYFPDGRSILFAHTYKWVVTRRRSSPRPTYPDRNLWMVDLTTKVSKQLTQNVNIREFAISPDGKSIVFSDEGPRLFILSMDK